jgi:HlyD family secretion protein
MPRKMTDKTAASRTESQAPFALSIAGLLGGCALAYLSGVTQPPLPPAFTPPMNPYPHGIYAEGMVESDQPSGENINVYPEVPGTVKQILVAEGQEVKKGTVLLLIDDSIQRATVEQLESQAQAASTVLAELKAQPRKETLDVAEAQVVSAQATLKTAQDELDKQQAAYDVNPKSISKDALDSAANAVGTARANLEVAVKQRDLTKAGAWIYDIDNQETRKGSTTLYTNLIYRRARCFPSTPFGRPKTASYWQSALLSGASSQRRAPTTATRKA